MRLIILLVSLLVLLGGSTAEAHHRCPPHCPRPTPTATPSPTATPTATPSPTATPTATPSPFGGLAVSHFWHNSDTASSFDASTDSARVDAFVAHYWGSWAQVEQYRINRPAGQTYFYADFGIAGDPCCVASVLDTATVEANGWWATHNGARIPNPWGGTSWLVDLGKPGVADAYVASLKAKWGTHPWTGVFADDVNSWRNLGYEIDGYSSATDWLNRAVLPLMRTVTDNIGGSVLPNIGNWPQERDMDAVTDVASGGFNEWFLTWVNGGRQSVGEIENEYASLRHVVDSGRLYLGLVHSTALTRYAFCAAAIMGERDRIMITNQMDYGTSPMTWDPIFELDLGDATEGAQHVAGSTSWSRRFVNRTLSIDTTAQTCAIS